MAQLAVTVNGRQYQIACEDGEEEHITDLADYVAKRVEELVDQVGQIGESRLLLMTALTVADELSTAMDEIETLKSAPAGPKPAQAAGPNPAMIKALTARIETIAARIENL